MARLKGMGVVMRNSGEDQMGVAETLNKSPKIVAIVVVAMVAAAGLTVWHSMAGAQGGPPASGQQYYSTDDGKTYFLDDASKGTSFQSNGQLAVEAFVFSCDNGNTKFVGFLQRIRPDVQQKIDAIYAAHVPGSQYQVAQMVYDATEVKRPGPGEWARSKSPKGLEIQQPKCPSGKGTPIQVEP